MVKEVWDSFKDNIKERVTNPFLGTFLLVWIVHNWRVVYAFLNFDKDYKLQNKIDYFNKYWTEHSFFWNLLGVALITVGVLIITYFFLALSRFFSNYFENVIVPFIYKISKGKTVTYETYQKELNKGMVMELRVEEERKLKNQALSERDTIEKLYIQLLEEKNSFEKTREEVRVEQQNLIQAKDAVRNEREQFSRERNDFIEEKSNFESELKKSKGTSKRDYSKIIQSIKDTIRGHHLEEIILDILKGYQFTSSNDSLDFLLKYGFIQLASKTRNDESIFKFTEDGEEFRKQFFTSE
jgi:hypothetical protein